MTRIERIEQITAAMKSFHKEGYQKSEILPELFNLQHELVEQAFGSENPNTENLKIWDVENKLAGMNESLGHVADEALCRFRNGSKAICNLIKSEISGNKGEFKAFSRLETMEVSHRIVKNVELTTDKGRTELDGVVLTRKGAFIIGVKNTRRNILIDEDGNYYRMGEYMNWDSNIGEKMEKRVKMLRDILTAHGYPECKIKSIVVFTNREVQVQNRDKSLKTTFLGPLPYIISEDKAVDMYSEQDLDNMVSAIEAERCREEYEMDLDIDQYKKDFAAVVVMLEEAQNRKEVKHHMTFREIFMRVFAPKKVQLAA